MTSSSPSGSGVSSGSGSGAVRTSVFTLSNVSLSTVGQYQCRATVSTTQSNVVDSISGVSTYATLTAKSKLPHDFAHTHTFITNVLIMHCLQSHHHH